jgi:hypothetical protein
VTPEGIPIGIVEQSVHTRSKAKIAGTREEKKARPIEEKESYRWLETMERAAARAPVGAKLIHVADREGDIYELFALAERTGQQFVIRVVHERVDTQQRNIKEQVSKSEPFGILAVVIPENHALKRKERTAELTLRYLAIDIKLPRARKADKGLAASLTLNLISAKEETPPEGMEAIEWLLMTNLSIQTAEDIRWVMEIYRLRWKIERFHFVLKSGCNVEKIQQRSVERFSLMLLMYSIIAIQIMMLTFMARSEPETDCDLLFSETEWRILYQAATKKKAPERPYSMAEAIKYVAKLGGFVGAPSDGPAGLKVIWLGLSKLYTLCAYIDCFH